MPATADHLTLGLRFTRADGHQLRQIAGQLRMLSPEQIIAGNVDISLFDKAAESAEQNEPLVVRCSTKDEAESMAQAFVNLGCNRPAIDELNG